MPPCPQGVHVMKATHVPKESNFYAKGSRDNNPDAAPKGEWTMRINALHDQKAAVGSDLLPVRPPTTCLMRQVFVIPCEKFDTAYERGAHDGFVWL